MRMLMLALVIVAGAALPASAQYTRNVGRDHGQWDYYGYRTTHWCAWSAARSVAHGVREAASSFVRRAVCPRVAKTNDVEKPRGDCSACRAGWDNQVTTERR